MLKEGSHHSKSDSFSDGDEQRGGVRWSLVAVGLLIVIALAFVSVPAIKGYKVYRAMRDAGVPEQYVTDMQGLAAAKAQLEAQLASATSDLDARTKEYGLCVQERKAKEELVTSLGADLSDRATRIEQLQTTVDEQQAGVVDAARRICCADKALRDPAINGYVFANGKIACVVEGGESISC